MNATTTGKATAMSTITTATEAPATDKQLALIDRLRGEKDLTCEQQADLGLVLHRGLTLEEASARIDFLFSRPARTSPDQVTEPGMYRDPSGTFYKVQVSKAGNLYAKTVVVTGEEPDYNVAFEYAPGAVRRLAPSWRLTLEEATAFGVRYGTCVVCGRTLTAEESVAAGIGPVCAGRI